MRNTLFSNSVASFGGTRDMFGQLTFKQGYSNSKINFQYDL